MNKVTSVLHAIRVFLVSLIGIDAVIWERVRGTPEGRRVLRSAIALVVGPVVFLASYWSALKVLGVQPLLALLVATFVTMALFVIDQMLFCSWVENTLSGQPRLLRWMRRGGIPAILVGATTLGLPGWLGEDSKTGLTQAVNATEMLLKKSSPRFLAVTAELTTLQEASEELAKNEKRQLTLNTEIAQAKTDMSDQENGYRLRNGGIALPGKGPEYGHHVNLIKEKSAQALELTARNADLKIQLGKLDAKKLELSALEAQIHQQAVDQVGTGVAVQLGLVWHRMAGGDFMLGITASVYMLTSLAVEAIVYMALAQAPPMNVAQMMQVRSATGAAKLHILAMDERTEVMREIPVVMARFMQTPVRGGRPKAVPPSDDKEAA